MPLRFHMPDSTVKSQIAVATPSTSVVTSLAPTERVLSPEVESYLRQVESHLKRVPETVRTDARQELQTHLESLIAAYVEMGDEPHVALAAALRQIGKPETIATHYRRAWSAPALYRRREMIRDTIRFAVQAAAVGVLAFCALALVCDQSTKYERLGHRHIVQILFNGIGLPLVSKIGIAVPILIGRRYGKQWSQSQKAGGRFWILLALQTAVWSFAEQFLMELINLQGNYKSCLERWEPLGALEGQLFYTIPVAILAALYTYQRHALPSLSRRISLGLTGVLVGWCLIDFRMGTMFLFPNFAKSITWWQLQTIRQYFIPGLLAIACFIVCQRWMAQKSQMRDRGIAS